MDRPLEIAWFERLNLATMVLGILNSWLSWDQLMMLGRSPTFVIMIQSITLGIILGLTLLVSRKRSNIAKWVIIVLFVLGLPITIYTELRDDLPSIGIIGYAQTTIQFVALVLLFKPASRRWFHKKTHQVEIVIRPLPTTFQTFPIVFERAQTCRSFRVTIQSKTPWSSGPSSRLCVFA